MGSFLNYEDHPDQYLTAYQNVGLINKYLGDSDLFMNFFMLMPCSEIISCCKFLLCLNISPVNFYELAKNKVKMNKDLDHRDMISKFYFNTKV